MKPSESKTTNLLVEVLIEALQKEPEYVVEWAHCLASACKAVGITETQAYSAAATFLDSELRTFVWSHPSFPPCEAARRAAPGVLEALGYRFYDDKWIAPPDEQGEPDEPHSARMFDMLRALDRGQIEKALADTVTTGTGVLQVLHVPGQEINRPPVIVQEMDEARADAIGQNGNDGEHYAESDYFVPPPMDVKPKPEVKNFKEVLDSMLGEPKPQPKTTVEPLRRADSPKGKPPAIDLPNTDQMVDPSGRPAWVNVPTWVKWIGQDRAGVWSGFLKKPAPRQGKWYSTGRHIVMNSGEPAFAQDFTETLEARP